MPIFNYVREHRRFIRYASDNKLTSSERLLWYALVDIINEESEGNAWPDGFIRISNGRLLTLCDPMGIDTMVRARNGLKQRGLIEFRPGNRNRENPAYRVKLFYPDGYTQNADKSEFYTQNAYNMGGNIHGNMWVNIPGNTKGNAPVNMGNLYINQNKGYTETETQRHSDDDDEDAAAIRAREDEDDPISDRRERENAACDGFVRAFGRRPYPAEINRLVFAGWRLNFSTDMVNRALEIAAGSGANKPVDYTIQILGEWRDAEVMQPHQIDEFRLEYERRTGRNGMYGTGDVVEDYRLAQEEKERRIAENAEAGIAPRYAAK